MLNDGTTLEDIQIVYKTNLDNYETLDKLKMGSLIRVGGELLTTPTKPQPFEIVAHAIKLLDQVGEDYPLQKKEQSPEFLREQAHLRARTKTFNAIFKIRSRAAFAFHEYFQDRGFIYAQTPIITSNDTEGAGETFIVTTRKDGDYRQDFFGKKAVLSVSGQLQAEALAQAFKKVYTFGPTFRAELSRTNRHVAEFWMIEPEVAFADLNDNMRLIEDMLHVVSSKLMKECKAEFNYLAKFFNLDLESRLNSLAKSQFAHLDYQEAINLLQKAAKEGHQFQEHNFNFGLDLTTEHERYLSEIIFKKPVFITNYPQAIKPFYMRLNSDNQTVAAVDLLVPGVGELVGGSEREHDYEKLVAMTTAKKMDPSTLKWYLDLRRSGYYKSAGFGLGFDRYLMYITGVANIRDVIFYPRTMNSLNF